MKNCKIILLRGHHLHLFREYLYRRYDKKWLKDKAAFLKQVENYSRKFIRGLFRTFERIIRLAVKIKIIDAFDNICRFCNKKREGRNDEASKAYDKEIACYYGLKINQIYNPEYVIRKIKEK